MYRGSWFTLLLLLAGYGLLLWADWRIAAGMVLLQWFHYIEHH